MISSTIPPTAQRVPQNTDAEVNEQIRRQTEQNIAFCAAQGREAIDRRLAELDREWDIERTLEANASTLALVGLTLGATVDRKWFLFPGVIAGFLLQHAVQGWCPPLLLFRRMGVRTAAEINYERYALKYLRGDFDNLPAERTGIDARRLTEAMRA
jgi:hypothetical protein